MSPSSHDQRPTRPSRGPGVVICGLLAVGLATPGLRADGAPAAIVELPQVNEGFFGWRLVGQGNGGVVIQDAAGQPILIPGLIQVEAAGQPIRIPPGLVHVQIQGVGEGGGAAEAAAENDSGKSSKPFSQTHPGIFKKYVDHRVTQLAEAAAASARQMTALWSASHGLTEAQAAALQQAAADSFTAVKDDIGADFGAFLDRIIDPALMLGEELDAQEIAEQITESLEAGHDEYAFYRPPAELRLENLDGWLQAVRGALPDAGTFDKWRQQVTAAEEAEQTAATEFLAERLKQTREQLEQTMSDQLQLLSELDGIDEAAQADVRKRGGQLVEATIASWREQQLHLMHRTDPSMWDGVMEAFSEFTTPDKWGLALVEGLGEEQQAAWRKVLQEQDDEEMRLFEARLDANAANYENHFRNSISENVEEVLLLLDLTEQQQNQFREASEQAVKEATEEWKDRARKWVDELDPEAREQAVRHGRVSVGIDSDMVQRQPSWSGSFATILNQEQLTEWAAVRDFIGQQRERVTARLVLLTIDQGIGLTPDQWQRMEALVAEADLRAIVERFQQRHFHMNPYEIGRTLRALDESKLREILTEGQWQRWGEYVAIVENPHGMHRTVAFEADEDDASVEDAQALESIISQFIHQRSDLERNRVMIELMAEVDYLRMTADLPEHVIQRLETGAKGAVEEVVDEWTDNFSRTVRERMQRVQRRVWSAQIASLAGIQFGHRDATQTQVWKNVIEQLEATGQAEARVAMLQKRKALHLSAVADLVTLHAASRLGISPERWPLLQEAVAEALAKYGPDFESALGRSSSSSMWYLRNPGIVMPVAAIPEQRLREILSEPQYQRWRDDVGSSTTGFWSRVESLHQQRVGQEQPEDSP